MQDDRWGILAALRSIVGADAATDSPAVRASYAYSSPLLGGPKAGARTPDYVVLPTTAAHVQAVLKLAQGRGVPVIVGGVGMLSYDCAYGGILLDTYSRMNRILEVNAEDGYALVEPGVTFGMLANALREHNYHFPFGSYPGTSSVVGHFVRSSGAWTMFGQAGGHEVISVEAVLGTGELVRTGYAAPQTPDWAAPAPHGVMPDLTALFLRTQGTLGVITKASVRIFDRNEQRALPVAAFDNAWDAYRYVRRLTRAYTVEHGAICNHDYIQWYRTHYEAPDADINAWMSRMLRSKTTPATRAPPGMPYVVVPLMLSGYPGELEHRVAYATAAAREFGGRMLTEKEIVAATGRDYYERGFKVGMLEHLPMDENIKMKYSMMAEDYVSNVFVGRASELARAEPEMVKILCDAGFNWVEYYFQCADQARCAYLRMGSLVDPMLPGEQRAQRFRELQEALARQRVAILSKYRLHPMDSWTHYYNTGVVPGSYNLLRRIQRYCDPKGILNPRHQMPPVGV